MCSRLFTGAHDRGKVSKIPLVVREVAFSQLRADEKKLANLTKEQ